MKTYRKLLAVILSSIFISVVFCGCRHVHEYSDSWSYDKEYHWKEPVCGDTEELAEKSAHTYGGDVCSVCGYMRPARMEIFPVNGNFHSEEQTKFLGDDYENIHRYGTGHAEKSLPEGVGIYWYYIPAAVPVQNLKEFRLSIIGERGDPINKTLSVDLDANYIQSYLLQNAYLNTRYSVEVQAVDNANQTVSAAKSEFTTVSTGPRNLLIDNVTNARDVGGYVTEQGTVKQGMLLRTARLNKSGTSEPTAEITAEGIRVMKEELKVKTEIDLRSGEYEAGGITESVLGEGIQYYLIGMDAGEMFVQKDEIKQVFDILCDRTNYPVFFHCHIGTDRTGFVAFLCEALLGVSEREIYVDYLFSNFGHIGGARFPYTVFLYFEQLKTYAGDTAAEQAESFLLECGITREQIAEFRDIMLEK